MKPSISKNNPPDSGQKGIAALPAVLMIAGIIVEVTVAGVIIGFSFANSGYGLRLAAEALSAARAGAEDAVYRVIRNDYENSYQIIVNGDSNLTADVVIEKDPIDLGSCAVLWGCHYRIRSTGHAFMRNRKMEVILNVDPASREIRISSFKEIPV